MWKIPSLGTNLMRDIQHLHIEKNEQILNKLENIYF